MRTVCGILVMLVIATRNGAVLANFEVLKLEDTVAMMRTSIFCFVATRT